MENKALLEAEKALREAHLKHRDKFIDVWGTKQDVKPWAVFVTEGNLKMMRTFENRDQARDYAKNVKDKHRLADVSAPHNIYGKNATSFAKSELAKVNTTDIFFSKPRVEKVARQKLEKKSDVKKQNLSLSL